MSSAAVRRLPRPWLLLLMAALLTGSAAVTGVLPTQAASAAGEANDEIHSNYGDDPATSMWVHWRGPDSVLHYGPTAAYGQTVTAIRSPITPVDIAGPFWRARVTGLTPGTVYHYKVGAGGLDHTFKTAPTGDFSWVDIGDTGSTFYDPLAAKQCDKHWMDDVWQQVAAANPDLVTHGGDISEANDCGEGNVHQFFEDIAPIAHQRPLQFAWGNHEYGPADAETAPPGTPQDQLANYKGRSYIPNPQTLAADTASRTTHPGCPPPPGGTGNGCRGYDWGSFKVGRVLFITYPEPHVDSYPEWHQKVDPMMAAAQADPSITFIVTYGHRPTYSSASKLIAPKLQSAVNALGDKYSPAARSDGKYVMNIGHHIHGAEVIEPQHGVLMVTNGGGGSESFGYDNTYPGSLFKTGQFSHLRIAVTGNQMTLRFICGPDSPFTTRYSCVEGAVIYTYTITSGSVPPPDDQPVQYVNNRGLEGGNQAGWHGVYNAASQVAPVQPTAGAHEGTWSLRVRNGAATRQTVGVLNKDPYWVTSTVAGRTYTGSAYVRGPAGARIYLMLRECAAAGSCSGYTQSSVTVPSTGWVKVQTTRTAITNGRILRFYLYSSAIDPGQAFYADAFSLTAPSG